MSEVCFYLKDPKDKQATPIYLQFKFYGQRLKYYFGQSIEPKNWNADKQRVKSNQSTTRDGQHSLNELLNNLEEVLLAGYRKELASGIPAAQTLKKYLTDFLHNNSGEPAVKTDLFSLIDRFIEGEIKFRGKDKSRNTTKTYGTVKRHLEQFAKKYKYPLAFESINLDFYYKYAQYLNAVGLAQNTKAKHIQVIKVFMNEALDLGLTSNMQHKHRKFSVSWEDTDAVYLTQKELIRLFNFNFEADKRLEQVRDLFVFGSFVGLRFSDYSDIKPEHIIKVDGDTFIKMPTKKTGELVVIPCNPIVLEIFSRYKHKKNSLPNSISNQKFNDYIKEACKEAKFVEKGRLQSHPDLELWQCISSHTARRSFATNLFLDQYPVHEIMKITGHKTEKSFLKYIRVSKLDTAKRLSAHIKKNWSEMLLRVAG